ncbi:MAG: hypothetical protein JNL11_16040 [Bdellovibrionaceae bacterium]|nr:hypothetical protein [Pseudobdellovibrionaceae bacterium]
MAPSIHWVLALIFQYPVIMIGNSSAKLSKLALVLILLTLVTSKASANSCKEFYGAYPQGLGWKVLDERPLSEEWAKSTSARLTENGPTQGRIILSVKGGFFRLNDSRLGEDEVMQNIFSRLIEYGSANIRMRLEEYKKMGIELELSNIEVRWKPAMSTFGSVPRSEPHYDGNHESIVWGDNQGVVIIDQSGKIFNTPSYRAAWLNGKYSMVAPPTLHHSPDPNEKPRLFIQWFFTQKRLLPAQN